jgi:hypothetical protein
LEKQKLVTRPLRLLQIVPIMVLQAQFEDVFVGIIFGATMVFCSTKIFPIFEVVKEKDEAP